MCACRRCLSLEKASQLAKQLEEVGIREGGIGKILKAACWVSWRNAYVV